MKDHYTIQEFYLMLKLGLFRNGKVGNWGYISINKEPFYQKKSLEEYQVRLYAKEQLGIGLYLLDLYLLEKGNNNQGTYIMVISVCRAILDYKEKTYVLKLVSSHRTTNIRDAIITGSLSRKRKSVFGRKSRKATFDASPLNSVPRKY
ncbi:MAG: hypothetical protein LBT43_01405 [Prevotella sp.]|jgi:hypothetical protein|nr:hypothetical protein [Prevotella sp.]